MTGILIFLTGVGALWLWCTLASIETKERCLLWFGYLCIALMLFGACYTYLSTGALPAPAG